MPQDLIFIYLLYLIISFAGAMLKEIYELATQPDKKKINVLIIIVSTIFNMVLMTAFHNILLEKLAFEILPLIGLIMGGLSFHIWGYVTSKAMAGKLVKTALKQSKFLKEDEE